MNEWDGWMDGFDQSVSVERYSQQKPKFKK